MTHNIYWILELSIHDGKLGELKDLMKEMSDATKNDEPGALNYEWWISEDDSTCHIYERYTDSEATLVHLGNFGSKFAARFMDLVQATGFTVYGDPNETLKGALADFGPRYMKPLGGFSR